MPSSQFAICGVGFPFWFPVSVFGLGSRFSVPDSRFQFPAAGWVFGLWFCFSQWFPVTGFQFSVPIGRSRLSVLVSNFGFRFPVFNFRRSVAVLGFRFAVSVLGIHSLFQVFAFWFRVEVFRFWFSIHDSCIRLLNSVFGVGSLFPVSNFRVRSLV